MNRKPLILLIVPESNHLAPTNEIKAIWMHVHKAFFVWGGFFAHVSAHADSREQSGIVGMRGAYRFLRTRSRMP